MAKLVDKEAKRKKILLAALQIIAKKGLADTRMADIAAAAKVGKGTLYEYFRNKEEMMHQGFLYIYEKADEILAQQLLKISDPAEKIRVILFGFLEAMEQFPEGFMEIMFDVWIEGVRSSKLKKTTIFDMRRLYADYRNLLVSILEEGMRQGQFRKDLNPNLVASSILGSLDGLMLQWVLDHSCFDFKEAAETMYRAYLSGIQR